MTRMNRSSPDAPDTLLLSPPVNIAFVILPMSCRVGDCPAWN